MAEPLISFVYFFIFFDRNPLTEHIENRTALDALNPFPCFVFLQFIAILVDLKNIEDSEPSLQRLLRAAAEPVTLGAAVIQVSASIGVTLYPEDAADADKLIRHADQAMYVAKQAGKNRYHLFDIAQDNAVTIV